MRLLTLGTLVALSSLLSCHEQPATVPAMTYSVPADLETYVQAFRTEAAGHNQPMAVTNLVVDFGTTSGSDVCGQCQLVASQPPHITLSAACWKTASANERECLVFHELGHCLLGRVHRTERFPNQAYVSLMNPDDINVYATCPYPIGNDVCDKRPRRAYYIDELFNQNTPVPDWGH